MKRNKFFIFFSYLLLTISGAKAQDLLPLDEAVRMSLENNYDIRLVANDLDIDRNNVTIGNAGFLPGANAIATNNNSIQSGTQTRAGGLTETRNNARNASLNYGVTLGWTVFDGLRMFARYDQLEEFEKLGERELEIAILSTVGDVISVYYDLVQQQQQLKALDTAIVISQERVRVAQARYEIGRAARLEVLNAQVDLNTDTTALLRQEEQYINTQVFLNQLLARDVNTQFRVIDSISIDNSLQIDSLTELASNQNPALQAAIINKRIAKLELRQVKANRYPWITLNSGYNFNQSQSAFGFATQSNNRGLTYGATASVNIFNGFNQRRLEQNAKILINSAELEYERLNQNINAQLASAYQTYQTNLRLVKLESSNLEVAKQNLDITMEKFRLGTVSPLEIREAQLNFVNATVRFSNAQYEAKLAEVALKEIAGNLKI